MSSREGKATRRHLTQELILDPNRRVRELSEIGSSVKVDKAFSVKRYFRSGSEMERQARVYYTEGQMDKAFILYNKFVTLFVEKLPKQYPDYNKPEFKEDRAKIKKLVKEAFPRAEQLKKHLLSRFEAEKRALEEKLAEEAEKRRQEEEERRVLEQREREEKERRMREEAERREREEAERVAAFLAAGGNSAVSESSGDAIRSDGVGPNQLSTTATEISETVAESQETTRNDDPTPTWTLTAQTDDDQCVVATMGGLALNDASNSHPNSAERSVTATNPQLAQVLPPTYQGPPPPTQNFTPVTPPGVNLTPPAQAPRTYHSIFSGPSAPPPVQMAPPVYSEHPPPTNPYYHPAGGQGVQIPPPAAAPVQYQQAGYYHQQGYQPVPPPGGPYVTQYSNASSTSWGSVELPAPSFHMSPHTTPPNQTIREEEDEESPAQVPSFDRSKKPSYNPLSTSIGGGYRVVHVPESISRKFEEAASANTRQNVETCAILAGKLSHNHLHVTHMILPKQKGGPDSCETLSEEELFDVQDQHDLITLGWIHTHPSQTAFMSSVDLHTHCSYQIMLDEAIAIVCAPRYNQVGIYMLTEPYGLDYITHCEAEGFHTHPKEPPLYEECSVIFSQSPIEVVDLR